MSEAGRQPRSPLRDPRVLLRHLLQLDDSHHSIALGAAIGIFIGWTPTVGIQMILVLVVALLARPFFRFNQIAGLACVYVSNPLTTVPMYWLMYKVGAVFVGGEVTLATFDNVLEYQTFAGWQRTIATLFVDVGWPLLLGSLILATVFGAATYPAMRSLLRLYGHSRSRLAPEAAAPAERTDGTGAPHGAEVDGAADNRENLRRGEMATDRIAG